MKESPESHDEKHSRVTITLPPDLLESINRLAEKQDRSRSKVITRAMRFYIQMAEDQGFGAMSAATDDRR